MLVVGWSRSEILTRCKGRASKECILGASQGRGVVEACRLPNEVGMYRLRLNVLEQTQQMSSRGADKRCLCLCGGLCNGMSFAGET